MFEAELQRLLESWKKSFGQYRRSRKEAEKAVVRWEWTKGERYNPLPFHFVRYPGRGRVLKDGPDSFGYYILYGFNNQDMVCLHREYQYTDDPPANFLQRLFHPNKLSYKLVSETYYHYFADQIEIIEFSAPPNTPVPLTLEQIDLENGKVLFHGSLRLNGYTPLYSQKAKDPDNLYAWLGPNGRFITAEAYLYEGKRLKTISGYYETPGIGPYSAQEHFLYDEAGTLLSIDRIDSNGRKQAVYRKRKQGQTFQDIRKEATKKLAAAVTQRVRAANIREKIYSIELSYNKYSEQFPPCLLITPESYRLNLLQSNDPADRYRIFSPILENEWFYIIDDPETLELCQVLEQEIRAGDRWAEATAILRDIAAILTRQDWTGIIDTTPDFVVYALDPELEGQDIVNILRSSVSEKQIQEWIRKGWLT